jgi:hypothetical protein
MILRRRRDPAMNAPADPRDAVTALECRQVERRFGGLVALTGVDLRIERGEIFGLADRAEEALRADCPALLDVVARRQLTSFAALTRNTRPRHGIPDANETIT